MVTNAQFRQATQGILAVAQGLLAEGQLSAAEQSELQQGLEHLMAAYQLHRARTQAQAPAAPTLRLAA